VPLLLTAFNCPQQACGLQVAPLLAEGNLVDRVCMVYCTLHVSLSVCLLLVCVNHRLVGCRLCRCWLRAT
jgi:hypothetical protein